MKKQLTAGFSALVLGLVACGSNNEQTGEYDPSEYNYTLVNTAGEETEIFEENENALYLYFTGTN
ncbi:hypothetical protein [Salisediminibacterium halotolerans]|uniref:hypothetical protein n=1 Tax=Salisediminibacterium halotolerans TaxID=517425 RepID=UPI000EB0F19D|nr:hypothetical protein [Salisediminibacterium halotolerans]RLJ80898.1 hypothetical protein BCL39_0204 [Actinophytocola xinjiangensis]RPE83915.1 hypothetical protein EDD67_2475 [Salisediminibacterium halotolerans]GEL08702.1 hypothetical protein SHA02_21180 [Salisediminibacterium halotolerans]